MDFITVLPVRCGYSVILVAVDWLSKYAHFILLKANYNSKVVAVVFYNML